MKLNCLLPLSEETVRELLPLVVSFAIAITEEIQLRHAAEDRESPKQMLDALDALEDAAWHLQQRTPACIGKPR